MISSAKLKIFYIDGNIKPDEAAFFMDEPGKTGDEKRGFVYLGLQGSLPIQSI